MFEKGYGYRRKEAVRKSKEVMRTKGDSAWLMRESPLLRTPDKPVDSYDFQFRPVLPDGAGNLKEYIEDTLATKYGDAVLLELGGTGTLLARGFSDGFFKKSAGVSLSDFRDDIDPRLKLSDKELNHRVIEGDILTKETQESVRSWLGEDKKVDVMIERMAGGHDFLPNEPFYMAPKANTWYELLDEGGILFAEVPDAFLDYMTDWEQYLSQNYGSVIDLQVADSECGIDVRLQKLSGAPEQLPLLPAKDVMEQARRLL